MSPGDLNSSPEHPHESTDSTGYMALYEPLQKPLIRAM